MTSRRVAGRLLAAALLLLAALPAMAGVRAELDRNRITEGETVTLTYVTDDPGKSLDADLSPLEKDFEILDRRTETQLSIVNGRQTAVVRLLITLEPLHTGALEIPAMDFDGDRTQALSLQVQPAPKLAPGELPPVFLETEIVPADGPHYVHAQMGLVVRVFYQQNLTEAKITQPDPSPGSVRLLHETPYQAERGGQKYRVLERNYAIFPERSGDLEIPPMELSGRLVERRDSGIWQPVVRGRRITVKSDPIKLHIEPRPAAFSGEWQPARDYQLSQQISSSDALRVGEPVTRTVIIDAVGLEENMIVEPKWPELQDARVYPDQPQGITRDDGEWVLGHKEFRYAVVPEKPGELVLPDLKVHWWDTVNNREQTAVLPGKTLQVLPSALTPPPPPQQAAGPQPSAAPQSAAPSKAAGPEPAYWRWGTLLFAGLWLATLMLAWRWKKVPAGPGAERQAETAERGEVDILRSLKSACEQDNPAAARHALRDWLRKTRDGTSLFEFARSVQDDAVRQGVYSMESAGYSASGADRWNGRAFWASFDAWRKHSAGRESHRQVEPDDLYAPENRPLG
ncbi:MAG: BatD family protein [Lysobacterales bacterium]|jgi:hypothetical protein